ncbi:hypothetical protein [Tsuneonella suprasediminis]|uniref:hypothetical protein n=1 Tax=Tsuneonella suprasediminis TaxID=2306996 RepID=UPI002F935104
MPEARSRSANIPEWGSSAEHIAGHVAPIMLRQRPGAGLFPEAFIGIASEGLLIPCHPIGLLAQREEDGLNFGKIIPATVTEDSRVVRVAVGLKEPRGDLPGFFDDRLLHFSSGSIAVFD